MPSPTHPPTDTGAIGAERSEDWHDLSCDEQFALATRIAANIGYDLTPERSQSLLDAARDLLSNLVQIIDVVKQEWSAVDSWSDWDAQQRQGITNWLTEYYALLAQAPSPATTPTGVLETSLIVEGDSSVAETALTLKRSSTNSLQVDQGEDRCSPCKRCSTPCWRGRATPAPTTT